MVEYYAISGLDPVPHRRGQVYRPANGGGPPGRICAPGYSREALRRVPQLAWLWLLMVLVGCGGGGGGSSDGGGASPSEQPDPRVASADAGTDFLADVMDRYHERLVVYDDVSSAGNHFVAYGKIPDGNAPVALNGSWSDNPHAGATAMRCEFSGTGFGGFYFLNGLLPEGAFTPQLNFGKTPDAGVDLSGARLLRFWARGENGGEKIDFFVAGVGRHETTGAATQPYPGSSPRHPAHGHLFTLTKDWKSYTIDVSGLDLSYLLGGFGWAAGEDHNPSGAVFYLDDIEYELGAKAREARLDQPRFLTSFVTLPVQAWSILADIPLARENRLDVLGCAESQHRVSGAEFTGFDFNEDQDGVWFEGTGHMALAYAAAGLPDNVETLAAELRRAQSTEPYGDGAGIAASARDGLSTGFGFEFYRRLHIAATSWLVYTQLGFNPYYQQPITS